MKIIKEYKSQVIISCFLAGVNLKRPRQGVANIVNAGFTNVLLDIGMCSSEGSIEIFGKKRALFLRNKCLP